MSQTRYFSTRGGDETLSFDEAVLRGLAPNGGLYIPTEIPSLPANWETEWEGLSFPELSHRILSLFVPEDSIPSADLKDIIDRSYATFRSSDVTPLRQTGDGEYVLELWHGPTWAFKDVALQFVGNVFAYLLEKRNAAGANEHLTVLGATSGDTGSAAIYGLRSKPSISIFILFPDGRVSPIQQAQMATVEDANVYTVAVQGGADFDKCQAIVKSCFSDPEFNAAHRLGAVNSINWARILAQIVYYFQAYFLLPKEERGKIQFTVPTGNFGDILAGWFAKRLGLPCRHLVVATNENDILARFFATGRYERENSDEVKATYSPAMDIALSSNFERLLWYLAHETQSADEQALPAEERRAKAQATLNGWMDTLKRDGRVDMGAAVRDAAAKEFWAERVSDEDTLAEIRKYAQPGQSKFGPYVVDPHTAVGLASQARSKAKATDSTWVTLSTAHPAKFSEAVDLALTKQQFPNFDFKRDVLPEQLAKLESLPQRLYKVTGEDGVRELIEAVKRGEKPTPA